MAHCVHLSCCGTREEVLRQVPGLCISPALVVEKEGCQAVRVRCTRCSSFGEALDVSSVTGSPFAFEEIFLIL